jgi:uncharacterized protein YdhG (YjbR/CyaY superfamily)
LTKFASIESYIQSFPDTTKEVLSQLYACIKQQLPKDIDEVISYGIPTFKLNGSYVVYFAGFAKHVSLFPAPVEEPKFRKEFAKYKTGKGTIQFLINEPLPEKLIARIVNYLLKQNQIKHSKK